MFLRYNVMFANLCIISFNGFSKLISTILLFQTYYEMIQKSGKVSVYLKVQACVFTWFLNKSVCIYDNKHASKQISWIDELQNKKDIQLSLVNIMSFCYRAALLHWL